MKFTLSKPIEFNGTTYAELNFREAETGDLMTADKVEGQTSKIAAILASMADIPLPAFRKIKAKDFSKIMADTASLMGEPEPTVGD